MMSNVNSMYREIVLDHHRNPRGEHSPDRVDARAEGENPTCGDDVALELKLENGRVVDAGVHTHGCAISRASGSMLAELVNGLSVEQARRVADVFKGVLQGEEPPSSVDLGDLEALTGVRKFPVRIKCALLPWVTLLDALLPANEVGQEK